MKLKLDLHTHIAEATNTTNPRPDLVEQVLNKAKERGLHGMALTEHNDWSYGYRFIEMAETHFGKGLLLFPGQEKTVSFTDGDEHVVEFELPNGRFFRTWAHPQNLDHLPYLGGPILGIEIRPYFEEAKKKVLADLALSHNFMVFPGVSDAHFMSEIGLYYSEVSLDELTARSIPNPRRNGHQRL